MNAPSLEDHSSFLGSSEDSSSAFFGLKIAMILSMNPIKIPRLFSAYLAEAIKWEVPFIYKFFHI
jgi:hypothetical protein